MTDPQDMTDMDDSRHLPDGVTEEYRDITDDDVLDVGTNQTTLGEASGGIDDLDDRLDEDLVPLDEKTGE